MTTAQGSSAALLASARVMPTAEIGNSVQPSGDDNRFGLLVQREWHPEFGVARSGELNDGV
jgi:hypothetical protein